MEAGCISGINTKTSLLFDKKEKSIADSSTPRKNNNMADYEPPKLQRTVGVNKIAYAEDCLNGREIGTTCILMRRYQNSAENRCIFTLWLVKTETGFEQKRCNAMFECDIDVIVIIARILLPSC